MASSLVLLFCHSCLLGLMSFIIYINISHDTHQDERNCQNVFESKGNALKENVKHFRNFGVDILFGFSQHSPSFQLFNMLLVYSNYNFKQPQHSLLSTTD